MIPQPAQVDSRLHACYAGNHMRSFFDGATFYDGWTDGRVAINGQSQMDIFVDRIRLTPTAVMASSFSARAALTGVELTWRTATETHAAGFVVWRSTNRDGRLVKVTRKMLPAKKTGAASGARYRFVDDWRRGDAFSTGSSSSVSTAAGPG